MIENFDRRKWTRDSQRRPLWSDKGPFRVNKTGKLESKRNRPGTLTRNRVLFSATWMTPSNAPKRPHVIISSCID